MELWSYRLCLNRSLGVCSGTWRGMFQWLSGLPLDIETYRSATIRFEEHSRFIQRLWKVLRRSGGVN